MLHFNILRSHRRQWALSQSEVAHLIGLKARSSVSRYELDRALPALRTAVAYEFVFGVSLSELFPALAVDVVEEVMRRAAELDEVYWGRADPRSVRVQEFLQALSKRAIDGASL